MFRAWFDEPRRVDAGLHLEAVTVMQQYRQWLGELIEEQTPQCGKYTRYELWVRGMVNALDELEQSLYCAAKFREQVSKKQEALMDAEERDNYRRHVYFYKNSFIRIFSVLDKLGYFINDVLRLRAERVKQKFSYFTVLRQLRLRRVQGALCEQLSEIKERFGEPMDRLRQRRNMEIHLVNTEMLDDLLYIDQCRTDRSYIEDLNANMADLNKGFEMVCRTLAAVFAYTCKHKLA